jgi:hypothetical protein
LPQVYDGQLLCLPSLEVWGTLLDPEVGPCASSSSNSTSATAATGSSAAPGKVLLERAHSEGDSAGEVQYARCVLGMQAPCGGLCFSSVLASILPGMVVSNQEDATDEDACRDCHLSVLAVCSAATHCVCKRAAVHDQESGGSAASMNSIAKKLLGACQCPSTFPNLASTLMTLTCMLVGVFVPCCACSAQVTPSSCRRCLCAAACCCCSTPLQTG